MSYFKCMATFSAALVAMQTSYAQNKAVSPLSLSVTLSQTTFGIGAPLTATIRVTNNTHVAVQGPEIGNAALTAEWIRFELRDENGKLAKSDSRPRTRWGRDPLPPEPGQTLISNSSDRMLSIGTLGPGKSFETKVLITPWLTPSYPGRYTLVVRAEFGIEPNSDPNSEVVWVPRTDVEVQTPITVEKMNRAKLLEQAKELSVAVYGPDTSTYNGEALESLFSMPPSAVQSVWRTFALNPMRTEWQQSHIAALLENQGSLEAARIIGELWQRTANKPERASLQSSLEVHLRRIYFLAPEPATRAYAGRLIGMGT